MQPVSGERYWPLIRDIGAFFLGAFILVDQTVVAKTAQTILVVIAFACLGITGSGIAQRWLRSKYDDVASGGQSGPPAQGGGSK